MLLSIVAFVSPRISLLYGHVNTHVLELVDQMTAKDERERAWKGAVVRSFQMHSQQLTREKQYFCRDNQQVGNLTQNLTE